ncbi:cyanidin 3-O-rutinoside 5-O-glucosyltransferase [Oryza sativa Japonica Group]|uniref:Glycosyltransferase n=2 Tax=Oryza sativa subsp. japonica TaxID=39947 RepID=Q0DB83_ORYSJ|nr:cyanidin 3-O-rutinoside 5-O-glucosyltransferase [Oryza sativa Japonica Group]BAD32868.1 putative glucosyltransferase [Oryza sativa Japonica Group]BAF19890.1 Os06g0593200 [Oryza sativa Japonica Group]BAS98441.1 Os06g0593200 [Oryza sativa Japonica Group]|eukprot:NP_001057976.1 Os06g0593200 [Oryza sativa Japonica Group]
MAMEKSPPPAPHFLFVVSGIQGHINPARRLAARLMASAPAARVTFSTAVSAHRLMFPSLPSPAGEDVDDTGVAYVPHSDGYDDGYKPGVHARDDYMARTRAAGTESLSAIVAALAARGRPVTCIVYTFLVVWAPAVARALGIPSAIYWIQPAAAFAVYYHYFHGHGEALASCANDPARGAVVRLPGMPFLRSDELPSAVSIVSPEHKHYLLLAMLRDLFEDLDELKPRVLVNTFDALEPDALRAVPDLEVVAVGPVVPDGEASLSSSSTDMFRRDDASACVDWLDTKPARSVVYVSFGTLLSMSKRQEEEMRRGLEATGRPYLWVARQGAVDGGATLDSAPTPAADAGGGGGEGDAQGMVVEWCDQMKVLSHPAVGCFVTHCGWNSALESITRGVPMVAVPQWTDQPTVAWLVEARMGAGVRARLDGEGVVERGELQRCVELAMAGGGDGGVRARAERWRERAAEAVAAGGSSERNLRAFASGAVTQAVCSSR